MTQGLQRKPFKIRLVSSIILWLVIVLLVGGFGVIVFLLPGRSENEMRGAKLPPLSDLMTTEGKIVELGYKVSRRGPSSPPKIEFQIDGKTFQFRTIDGYGPNAFPFQPGQTVEVLYDPSQPEKAWLKWEYDSLIENYEGISKGLMVEKVREFYPYFGLVGLGISGVLLLVNLFFPIFRWFKPV